jgi:hypothetical protein
MATPSLDRISQRLAGIGSRGSFAARRTAGADNLRLEVKGVGTIRFPLSHTKAKQLCRIGRPARYGKGEQTLRDRSVRDTWEIPRSRVKIDGRRWRRTLVPVLDALRGDLGLPEGCTLRAELHSMLIYEPGQFFLPHQDSEKADDMVGTLVVTLPSPFRGGAFVVRHRGEEITYRASKHPLSFVAFYADCRHEVRPVKGGYRVVLTYNLMLESGDALAANVTVEPDAVDELAQALREHFETPLPPREWDRDGSPGDPPSRFVYLLDHQYTERGFGWEGLKGADVARVTALRAAAEQTDCEVALALAEVHETWGCMEEGWNDGWHSRHRHWERGDDDEWESDDDVPADSPEEYELVDLHDRSITLHRWIEPGRTKSVAIQTTVYDHEVCTTTPSVALEPYQSEYEGYMGNYGNTMDRWYRRAALVLWPREHAFAVRAEASPSWAMSAIRKRIRAGAVEEARDLARSLLPMWSAVARSQERRGFFDRALAVALGLDEPELAASLLEPFHVELLNPRSAPGFRSVANRYGEPWLSWLLSRWSERRGGWGPSYGADRFVWLASLPDLCEALTEGDGSDIVAELLLEDRWDALREEIEAALNVQSPSTRNRALGTLVAPTAGIVGGAAIARSEDVHHQVVDFLCSGGAEPALPLLLGVLRAADSSGGLGLDAVRRLCVRSLEKRLAAPEREPVDWSVSPPGTCGCDLCQTLGEFLAAADRIHFEWPLAKDKRRHVHEVLDTHELPVRHETRRQGRPFTLVLDKTKVLFEREADQRKTWRAELELLKVGPPVEDRSKESRTLRKTT